MAGLRSSLYCLPLLAIMFYKASCEHTPYDSLYHEEDALAKSFDNDFGAGAAYLSENDTEEEKLDAVLGLLEKIQTQVDELQSNVETVCSTESHRQTRPIVLRIVEKAKCPQDGKTLFAVFFFRRYK